MTMLPALPALFFYPAIMVLAGLGDLKTMKIPNRLVMLLLGGYIVLVPLSGLALQEIALSAATAIVVFLAGFGAFACRWMGGGDVKLMAVTALWLGAPLVPSFVIYMALIGALLTGAFLVFRACPLPAGWRGRDWISRLHNRETGIPYGLAIAVAGIVVFLETPWLASL
ncbi:MAG: A24 family peptidase [Limimaricola soesokkakensis]|uniref:A24 family peptidase n=1 Tax=Limimaricola soesokkakensis TaxID=1343159 RepID=UPI00405998A0